MTTRTPSHVWEEKKAEIFNLYVEEGLPAKVVMNRIRYNDFNPTFAWSPFLFILQPMKLTLDKYDPVPKPIEKMAYEQAASEDT